MVLLRFCCWYRLGRGRPFHSLGIALGIASTVNGERPVINIKKLSPDKRRGYIVAREFIFSQIFLWVGVFVGIAHYALSDRWDRNISASAITGFVVSLIYLPFLYVRAILKAWRVWRGHDEPDEITEAQEKSQTEAATAALKQLAGGGS